MKWTKVMLLVAGLAACGGVEGTYDEVGSSTEGLAGPISAVPYWTAVWETDIGSSPFAMRNRCTFGDRDAPMLVGGFVMDVDRHFGGQAGPVRRVCGLEANRDILVPIVTISADGSTLDRRPSERTMAARVSRLVSSARNLRVLIDGKDARSMNIEFVRTFPEVYSYMLPPAGALYELPDGEREVTPAVADGIFMTLPGLMPGRHRLVIEGVAAGRAFRTEYLIDAQ